MSSSWARGVVGILLAAVATRTFAQSPAQSALLPASEQAGSIDALWNAMFIGGCIIFTLVMLLLAIGLWRARHGGRTLSHLASRNIVVAGGVLIPVAVLTALVGGSLFVGRDLNATPPNPAATIEVIGWRWWWEVRYLGPDGELLAITANEIHVPVGQPVAFQLKSADVIHSFWVPNLHGKTDLVPGRTNESWFQVDRPGVFRGQCAEFCGTQHAMMGFIVVAEPPDEFSAWLANQRHPAQTPDTAGEQFGRAVFQRNCASCHQVRQTALALGQSQTPTVASPSRQAARDANSAPADRERGLYAPDLTHFGSRRTLAAAIRPSTAGHIAGWIADPQSVKPGSLMPATKLAPDELMALVSYLQSLR